jgi:5-methylcytosine-specific restriction endonuclease McrBC regulatory subunit McrC
MWDVYERYVVNLLNRQYESHYQRHGGARLRAEAQLKEWHLATYADAEGESSAFHLKPDIVIYRDHQPVLVADTKWKTVADEDTVALGNLGVQPADAYQLFAYSRVIGHGTPLPVALIYPTVENSDYLANIEINPDSPLSHLGEPLRSFKLESPKGPSLSIHLAKLPS